MDGPLALSPVDVELDIEVGKRPELLNMVARDVMVVIGLEFHVIEEDIVQV